MNISKIEDRFDPDMLTAIKAEVDNFVKSLFTLDDYTINQHLVDSIFIQPIYYSTLLNYYTMYEQRSTLSLRDVFEDDVITTVKKDTFMSAMASDVGIDTAGMDSADIVSAIENRITVSESRIHSDMMNIVREYSKAIDGATGVFWNMFRNSPDHMYFISDKFSAVVMSENLSLSIDFDSIMNQPITLMDITKYGQISNGGRVTNFIDIYVEPTIVSAQTTLSTSEGETRTVVLPARKWRRLTFPSGDIKCIGMDNGYVGFQTREITLEITGPVNGDVETEYYMDNTADESTIKLDNPAYDIEFYGLVPVDISVTVQNKNGASKISSALSKPMAGGLWQSKIEELSMILSKANNSIVSIEATVWINPLMSKKIPVYNSSIAVSPRSIFSWIDIANTCITGREIIDLETGDVATI